jgi:hypothetical protein
MEISLRSTAMAQCLIAFKIPWHEEEDEKKGGGSVLLEKKSESILVFIKNELILYNLYIINSILTIKYILEWH